MTADPTAPGPPAVELRGITKTFPGVVANHDVDLEVRAGEVHAVCGENGAGKSTLMKILYGMQRPDSGTIAVRGEQVKFRSPADAIKSGIGMVHQHFMLADNLTVLENVVLGLPGRFDPAAARIRIGELSARYGLGVDPDRLVEQLGVGERQRIEILKVLYRGARVIILDEPTAVLVPQEVDELFGNLAGLRAEGLTVLFISHKLDEVIRVADRITVLRQGTTVTTVEAGSVTTAQLAHLMVGGDLPTPETRESTVRDEVTLGVRELSVRSDAGRDLLSGVGLSIRAGEVVGIAGVEGNGQAELVEALLGTRPIATGAVTLAGEDITAWPTSRRREAGIGYIPEDRQRQGLLLTQPLWENRILGHQTRPPSSRGVFISRRGARKDTERIVAEFGVKTPGVDVPAFALSGGNQQKLVVGRELSGSPKLLVAAHPTRGVDVGAQALIWDKLRDARAAGLAVLLVSADLEELLGLSDTLKVMLRGRIVATLDPATVTPAELGEYMTGVATQEATP
jgi:simple sugar transport system ATP-binding protein